MSPDYQATPAQLNLLRTVIGHPDMCRFIHGPLTEEGLKALESTANALMRQLAVDRPDASLYNCITGEVYVEASRDPSNPDVVSLGIVRRPDGY